jgi:prevent-host-death family protein
MEIGIRELKDRLSEILHRANSGEEITITHHGRPLCQISPVETSEFHLPEYLLRAAVEGWLKPATTSGFKNIQGFIPKSGAPSSEEVLRAGRRDRLG